MDRISAQPEIFRGSLTDDAEGWIKFMDIWLETRYTNFNDKRKMCSAATFLRDAALLWFHSLGITEGEGTGGTSAQRERGPPSYAQSSEIIEKDIIKTYSQFREAFKIRFKRQPEEEREAVARLWEIRQAPGQTTEDYVNKIREIGEKIHATTKEQFGAAITGLRDDIRGRTLVQGHPKDLDQLIRWGTNAEHYKIISAGSDMTRMASNLADIDKTLANLIANQTANHIAVRYSDTYETPEPLQQRSATTSSPRTSSQQDIDWRNRSSEFSSSPIQIPTRTFNNGRRGYSDRDYEDHDYRYNQLDRDHGDHDYRHSWHGYEDHDYRTRGYAAGAASVGYEQPHDQYNPGGYNGDDEGNYDYDGDYEGDEGGYGYNEDYGDEHFQSGRSSSVPYEYTNTYGDTDFREQNYWNSAYDSSRSHGGFGGSY